MVEYVSFEALKRVLRMKAIVSQLQAGEISQIAEIEREAFPVSGPPTSFRRDLNNRLHSCLVGWAPWQELFPERERPGKEPEPTGLGRLLHGVRRLVSPEIVDNRERYILGFVSLWFGVEEAHVTAIAVRQEWRGLGIGELLMIGAIELARRRGSRVVSLEARASNRVAQALYSKYGFKKTGVRKGYYADNREDAIVMTTDPIDSPAYQQTLESLKGSYRRKRGEFELALV